MSTYNDSSKKTTIEPEFYTPEELAVIGNVPLRDIRKWAYKGLLPVVKWGRLNRFPRIEIQKRLLSGSLIKKA